MFHPFLIVAMMPQADDVAYEGNGLVLAMKADRVVTSGLIVV